MYSAPGRFVQTFLQVIEQVWQPMHLSRFITMQTCALIFMPNNLPTFKKLTNSGRAATYRRWNRNRRAGTQRMRIASPTYCALRLNLHAK